MSSKGVTFLLRLSSTVALWVLTLIGIFSGQEVLFAVFIGGVGLLGLWEYFRMLRVGNLPSFPTTGLVCAAALLSGNFLYLRVYGPEAGFDFELAVLVFLIVAVFARQIFAPIRGTHTLEALANTLFGLFYIPFLFNFLTKTVYLTPRLENGALSGQFYVLYVVCVTKFSDMGAYVVGMLFGRHPCVTHISPRKTWEGLGGAIFGAFLGSFLLFFLLRERLALLTVVDFVLLPLMLGAAAIVGDLAESVLKRSAGIKDSGGVLPGIGGVLDLIDSVLFTAPMFYFYLRLIAGAGMEV
ncbi:MAG: phosphatidate cytidylyltransferase [Chthoniobacterales bacterium]|nr:phosphatidate cytidylyltransferase [Chthoniobacterales bacterium]